MPERLSKIELTGSCECPRKIYLQVRLFLFCILFSTSCLSASSQVNFNAIKDLPLVVTETPSGKSKTAVLLISGDGGWYHFEQRIADDFATRGIATIGLDSRKYFWIRTTPEKTTMQLALALNYYGLKWGTEKFVIMGYSLGAEIVPFIINRLPEDLKHRVLSAVLLSPSTTTDFEIHITNMMGIGSRKNTYETVREIINMNPIHTLIIFGEGEKTEVPGLLAGTQVTVRKIPGDHHYKSDVPLIVKTMNENKVF